jgi:radical SAM superfamily enzyme YgiQ (UPF0313 family)
MSERMPVLAPWDPAEGRGLPLGLGMVTAHLRAVLGDRFDVGRPSPPAQVVEQARRIDGPAVLLLSDYVWSIEENLRVAHEVRTEVPEVVIVHGGPSVPIYDRDLRSFFAEHGDVVDVVVHGEGERTTEQLLATALVDGRIDLEHLDDVLGISFRRPSSGELVRTEARPRMAELDVLPSPYLTGDLDLASVSPFTTISFESNRGCPYGCTFCDWGSATRSRIRKFELDRVEAEMRVVAEAGLPHWMMADANFGIFSRDVELMERVVAIREEHGVPYALAISPAKNTTRHLVRMVDMLTRAGIVCYCSLALQSRDEATLEAIERQNISSDHYVELARQFRLRQLPLVGDIMLGLPGQTVDSYRLDLQFFADHEITGRTWPAQVLPNAPMNEPAYRERFQIVVGDRHLVRSTSTFDESDLEAMYRQRHAHAAFEHFGLLRHVGRHLQWDHGLPSTELARLIIERTEEDPVRYPLLALVMRHFDVVTTTPFGWSSFYDEVRRFLRDELHIDGPAVEVVLEVQRRLMPQAGRSFPDLVDLVHDYVRYHQDAADALLETGRPSRPPRRLEEYGPGRFEVAGDPVGLCQHPAPSRVWARDRAEISNFWMQEHWELDSVLLRNVIPEVASRSSYTSVDLDAVAVDEVPLDLVDELDADGPAPLPVHLGVGRGPARTVAEE